MASDSASPRIVVGLVLVISFLTFVLFRDRIYPPARQGHISQARNTKKIFHGPVDLIIFIGTVFLSNVDFDLNLGHSILKYATFFGMAFRISVSFPLY